jgi:hypothetical protein
VFLFAFDAHGEVVDVHLRRRVAVCAFIQIRILSKRGVGLQLTTCNDHVQCPERERLVAAYLSAVDRINDAGKTEPDRKGESWKRVTEEARRECIKTLETMNEHRREHGC